MLIGHQKQWQFFKKSLRAKRVPHGFLFQGQEKLGKKTFALEFIKLANCQNSDFSSRPCQKCLSCQEIEKKIHPDFVLIEPIKKEIQISQIRELNSKLASKPYLAFYKSAIIDQAHLMSPEAQSCFLKTLEEPKGKVILILVTEYPERLLPTILSRVQRIKFYPVKKDKIRNYLISQGLPEKKAKEISFNSFGKPGRALDFFVMPAKLENRKQKISDLVKICNSPLSFRFEYLKNLSLEFNNLKELLEIWLRYFRNNLLFRLDSKRQNLDESTEKKEVLYKREISINRYPVLKLKRIIQVIEDTIFYISTTNINPRLALESLILEL